MARLGFSRADFEAFSIGGFSARMEKIYERITPRLVRLGAELGPEISRRVRMELFPHVAKHMRRNVKPPAETWTAWAPSAKGYMRHPYLALCVSGAGIHARAIVKAEARQRAEMGKMIKASASGLEKSFRGSKIRRYEKWDFIALPRPVFADVEFFIALGAALEEKIDEIDVGFGWSWREALGLERDEVIDAFSELGPLYRALSAIA